MTHPGLWFPSWCHTTWTQCDTPRPLVPQLVSHRMDSVAHHGLWFPSWCHTAWTQCGTPRPLVPQLVSHRMDTVWHTTAFGSPVGVTPHGHSVTHPGLWFPSWCHTAWTQCDTPWPLVPQLVSHRMDTV